MRARITSLVESAGWKRRGFAFSLGVLLTLTMPPVGAWPLLFPALGGLFLLLQQPASFRRAALDGFWFGFGFCLTSFYWIAISLLVDAAQFGWLIPFAVFGLNAALALFWVLLGGAMFAARHLPVCVKPVFFAVAWLGIELLRSHIFTGFPWNLLASAWASYDITLQPLYWLGAYGYGVLTAFFAAFAMLPLLPQPPARAKLGAVCAVLALVLALGAGVWRLQHAHVEYAQGVQLRLVQASIPQDLKWDPAKRAEGVQKYISLSQQAADVPPTHIIWPESAVPYVLEENTPLADALREALQPNATLITGSLRVGERVAATPMPPLYNSVQVMNAEGQVVSHYDKEHLVPFGEYIPLRGWIPLEKKITAGMQDFARGYGQPALVIPQAPAAVALICYEVIFPSQVAARANHVQWMVNVTNDGWFGNSSGPYQHLAMARMRAVEQGLSVVRVANNGISAVIDPYGRVIKQLDLNAVGVIDSALPIRTKQKSGQ